MPRDPFTELVGLCWDEVTPRRVRAHLDVEEKHHQPHGIVHGGVHATIIEVAASVGAAMNVRRGAVPVGVANSSEFLRSHRQGRLSVEAVPVFIEEHAQLWVVDVTRDADGELVAKGTVRLATVQPRSRQEANARA